MFSASAANTDFTVATTVENITRGADNQTLTVAEAVANVSVGADTQTNTVGTTRTNISEVKASRTLAVGTLPINTESITIGACVVTFTTTLGATSDQTDCSSNTAIIDTDLNAGNIPRSPAEIAYVLAHLIGVRDASHGSLSANLNGSSVTFSTTGAETSTSTIAFTDSTSGKITSTNSVAGVIPVAQVSTVTPANIEKGDTFTVIINGTTISYTAEFNTVAVVTAGLTAAINASSQAANVTAADRGTRVDITSDTAGTAFTLWAGTANRTTTVAQVDTVTPANVEVGDTFTVIVNGSSISYTATAGTVANVTAGLTAAVNDSAQASNVTATNQTVRLDITSDISGNPFTISGGTINRPPVTQVSTVTPATIKPEETVYVSVNDEKYYYTTKIGDSAANVASGLKTAITSTAVTVSGTDSIILSAAVSGTPFTVGAGFSCITMSSTTGLVRKNLRVGNLSGNIRVGDITKTGAKIIWDTNGLADGTIYISKVKSKLKKRRISSKVLSFSDSTNSLSHGFVLAGLRSNTRHYFMIVSGNSRSDIYSFYTKNPKLFN